MMVQPLCVGIEYHMHINGISYVQMQKHRNTNNHYCFTWGMLQSNQATSYTVMFLDCVQCLAFLIQSYGIDYLSVSNNQIFYCVYIIVAIKFSCLIHENKFKWGRCYPKTDIFLECSLQNCLKWVYGVISYSDDIFSCLGDLINIPYF